MKFYLHMLLSPYFFLNGFFMTNESDLAGGWSVNKAPYFEKITVSLVFFPIVADYEFIDITADRKTSTRWRDIIEK